MMKGGASECTIESHLGALDKMEKRPENELDDSAEDTEMDERENQQNCEMYQEPQIMNEDMIEVYIGNGNSCGAEVDNVEIP